LKRSPTNKIPKEIEEEVIRSLSKIEEIEKELDEENSLIKQIDRAINSLSTIYKDIIQMKYIEGLDWQKIIDMTNYSERQLRNKKNHAVRSIAIALFGSKVFREEKPDLFNLINL
jgi:DNA-directed RNA polymerase specialized sigma24 family protein